MKPKLQAELKASEDALRAWANEVDDQKAANRLAAWVAATNQMTATFERSYEKPGPTFTPTECFIVLRFDRDFSADFDDRISVLRTLAYSLPNVDQLTTSAAQNDVRRLAALSDAAKALALRLGNLPRLTNLGRQNAELNQRLADMYRQEDEQLRQERDAPPSCDVAVSRGRQAFQQAREANCVNDSGELITDVARSECGTVNAAVAIDVDTIAKSCGFSLHNATRAIHGLPPE